MGPSYRSANVEVGEIDSSILFPPGYDAPPKQEQDLTKKPKKKRNKIVQQVTINKEGEEVIETLLADKAGEIDEEQMNIKEGEENDDEECYDDEEEMNIDIDFVETVGGEEKATSPMTSN